ncbi:cold-responsive protein kinase 1-like [Hordeum vulgare subsp. vulgare]|uniref:Similar to putative receptor protein kinase from A. thaliana n=1 Tax=Hordeum vulgare subsp. vulgare TaxID=112509 RepID=Q8S407_HORVV|nr:cold-responsive protein kinase 1-like [Hordeum vulgare subsp. vulgare]AAM13439.1 similar to putative receptor protein kinase from A. thaliana [Hordeum vulgare subsp. vulgare]
MAAADTSRVFLILIIALVMVIVVLLGICWRFLGPGIMRRLLRPRRCPSEVPEYFSGNMSGNLRTITYFDYVTLKKATKDFHQKNQLGRGGFGPVYLGKLDDGRKVAVKQLSVGKSGQGESEFFMEVNMITSIQHKNLVRLVGCCSEGTERLLVYEYMKNKSLDKILFAAADAPAPASAPPFLNWRTRHQIIIGIGRGLQYLHEESNLRIVHRDIKASNILLDDKFQPKISDFGLARFFPEDQTYLSTAFAGTLGYTAPEYAIRGELTVKADTYSFGVLVLEIISSRKNTDLNLPNEMQYLPEHAWRLYEQSKILELVDGRVQGGEGFEEKEVMLVCQIALLCVQPYPNSRPAMSEVVRMLTMKTDQSIPAPAKPAFLDRKNLNGDRDAASSDTATMEMMRSPAGYWMMTPSPMLEVDRPYDMSFGK